MFDPGQMRDRIRIERPTTVQDGTGGHSTTWAAVSRGGGVLWARKLTEKGMEAFAGNRLLGKVEIAMAIRWWPAHGLDALHRFVDLRDNRIYNIVSVVESEHRTELVLLGTSGANRG